MMRLKQSVIFMVLSGFFFFLIADAGSEEATISDRPGSFLLRKQDWYSSAAAKWQISFSNMGTGTGGESELTFNQLSSPLIIVSAGAIIDSLFSFDCTYGFGSISGGHGTDSDRLFPSSGGGGLEYSRSESEITGDVRLWEINLYIDKRRFIDQKSSSWGMVLGFLHYEDNLILRHGVQIIPVHSPFTQELDSRYDFSWDAFKVGITHRAPITPRLSYTGMLSIYPYVLYEGEGYWNLRTTGSGAFRSESPNFVQKSTSGYGYEAVLGLTYAPSDNVELSLGYRYLYLSARSGTDTLYFADGTSGDSRLDWVKVTRKGLLAGVLMKF
jgi:opacity protein-like surface antigen